MQAIRDTAMQCVSCERKPIISSCLSGLSLEICLKPMSRARVSTAATACGVLPSAGVTMKLASRNIEQSLFSMPEHSRPAIGCAGTNSTSFLSIGARLRSRLTFTPVTSVISVPGASMP